jgi:hypothetical protein
MIDHNSIVENNFAARYHLGELTDTECDAYEEHYFDCPECAEDMLCVSEFIDAVQRDKPEPVVTVPVNPVVSGGRKRVIWMGALPAGIFAVLLLSFSFGAYQVIVRQHGNQQPEREASAENPQVQQASMQAPVIVKLAESRGPREEQGPTFDLGPSQPLQLNVDIPARIRKQALASFQAVILNESGQEVSALAISRAEADDVVEWLLPVGKPGNGSYSATIRAFDSSGAQRRIKGKVPRITFKIKM